MRKRTRQRETENDKKGQKDYKETNRYRKRQRERKGVCEGRKCPL